MKITILETFRFDAKEHPYNLLGHWGCAFSLCQKSARIVPGEMAHKIQIDEDVDLIHPNCFVDMKSELKKRSIPFTVDDKTAPGNLPGGR
jgi:hypothetical protein